MFNHFRPTFLRRLGFVGITLTVAILAVQAAAQDRKKAVNSDNASGKLGDVLPAQVTGNAVTPSSNWVESSQLTVAVSKSGKTFYGYSTHTGTWDKVHVENAVKEFSPIVSGEVACLIVGKRAYAFGGQAGRWDSIELAASPEASWPLIDSNLACIVAGSRVYAFSGAAGRWDSIDLSGTKSPVAPVTDGQNRVRVEVGSKIYMFSAITGRWAAADLSVDAD